MKNFDEVIAQYAQKIVDPINGLATYRLLKAYPLDGAKPKEIRGDQYIRLIRTPLGTFISTSQASRAHGKKNNSWIVGMLRNNSEEYYYAEPKREVRKETGIRAKRGRPRKKPLECDSQGSDSTSDNTLG